MRVKKKEESEDSKSKNDKKSVSEDIEYEKDN